MSLFAIVQLPQRKNVLNFIETAYANWRTFNQKANVFLQLFVFLRFFFFLFLCVMAVDLSDFLSLKNAIR